MNMGILFWIAVLIFGIPFLFFYMQESVKTIPDTDKPLNQTLAYVLLAAGAVLLIMGFPNLFSGIFSSLKNFCMFVIKWMIGFFLIIIGVAIVIVNAVRKKWSLRITNALDGTLGAEIKKRILKDSLSYWVYDDRIIYHDKVKNQNYYLSFNELGYENIPAMYTNTVCEWISNNMVSYPENYRIIRHYNEYDELVSATSDTIKTVKTYDGYESYVERGDSTYKKVDTTICYQLAHYSVLEEKPQKALNKW